METKLILYNSSTNSSRLSTLSNTTTESLIGEETFKWTNAEIARLIHIIIRPILIILGTVGNCLTFFIMRKTSLKDVSSCFYMAVLALADTSKSLSLLGKNYILFTFLLICVLRCVLKRMKFGLILTST